MAKVCIGYSGATFGSTASNGSAVIFTAAQNPDHTAVKDTRK